MNWYANTNIRQRMELEKRCKLLLDEKEVEIKKRKRLEDLLQSKNGKITELENQNKRLKEDNEKTVGREKAMVQKYNDLLEKTKHYKPKECFAKHCESASKFRFKSLGFCSFGCAERTFIVKAINLKPF